MKRIVGIAALAAMTASLAMADVSTSINFRRGTNVFNNPNLSSNKVDFFQLGDITGTDAFTFKASNEYAGITLNYNPTSKADGKTFWSSGNGVEYTAYVNPIDWLQFKLGVHKDGIFYAEQAKKDGDDTAWGASGRYAFLYKPGVLTKNSSGYALDDLTSYQLNGTPFFFADFKFNEVGPGNLLVRASVAKTGKSFLLTGGFNPPDKVNKSVPTPGLMVAYKIKDLVDVNVDVQMVSNNDLAAGLYVSPSVVENLTLMVGGTVSTVFDGKKAAYGARYNSKKTDKTKSKIVTSEKDDATDGVTFFGIDLRLRYVAGDFHITNAFNFTGATEDGAVAQGQTIGTNRTGDSNIWDSLFVTYQLNESWTVTGNLQLQVALGGQTDSKNNVSKTGTLLDLAFTPGVMYTVTKGTTITAGLHMAFNDLSDKTSDGRAIGIALPVIFRVKL